MPSEPKVCPIRMHAIESRIGPSLDVKMENREQAVCIENRCASWDSRHHRCNLFTGSTRWLEQIYLALARIAQFR